MTISTHMYTQSATKMCAALDVSSNKVVLVTLRRGPRKAIGDTNHGSTTNEPAHDMAGSVSAAEGITLPTGLAEMSSTGLLITVVAFILVAIVRGWLIVKIHYDTAIRRAETAEAAVATLTATNAVQAQTIEKQTAVGETVVRVMNSVQEARATAGDTA